MTIGNFIEETSLQASSNNSIKLPSIHKCLFSLPPTHSFPHHLNSLSPSSLITIQQKMQFFFGVRKTLSVPYRSVFGFMYFDSNKLTNIKHDSLIKNSCKHIPNFYVSGFSCHGRDFPHFSFSFQSIQQFRNEFQMRLIHPHWI